VFGQDVQPEVLGVQCEFAREAVDHLLLDPGAIVVDVSQQGGLGRYQAAGSQKALVPARIESGCRLG
jgi:hypothetical protein